MAVRWPGGKKNLYNACILIDYAQNQLYNVVTYLLN